MQVYSATKKLESPPTTAALKYFRGVPIMASTSLLDIPACNLDSDNCVGRDVFVSFCAEAVIIGRVVKSMMAKYFFIYLRPTSAFSGRRTLCDVRSNALLDVFHCINL